MHVMRDKKEEYVEEGVYLLEKTERTPSGERHRTYRKTRASTSAIVNRPEGDASKRRRRTKANVGSFFAADRETREGEDQTERKE